MLYMRSLRPNEIHLIVKLASLIFFNLSLLFAIFGSPAGNIVY